MNSVELHKSQGSQATASPLRLDVTCDPPKISGQDHCQCRVRVQHRLSGPSLVDRRDQLHFAPKIARLLHGTRGPCLTFIMTGCEPLTKATLTVGPQAKNAGIKMERQLSSVMQSRRVVELIRIKQNGKREAILAGSER